jgi:hypothetical protein
MEKPRTKVCNTCHKEKPLSAFRKNFRYSDGREGRCKDCLKSRTTELNAQNVVHAEYFDHKSQPF